MPAAFRNANHGTYPPDLWAAAPAYKTMTFDGATVNDPGDFDGTGNPATLFTVTGTVLLKLLATVGTTLTGATATLAVGITGSTSGLITATTATDLVAGEIWHDATPDAKIEASSVLIERVVTAGDIIQTVGTANITAGVIVYTAMWLPLSFEASLVAA